MYTTKAYEHIGTTLYIQDDPHKIVKNVLDRVKNLYVGVPVVIGNGGIEKVIELPLSKNEKENFDLSINVVKELFQSAVKIDSDLGK